MNAVNGGAGTAASHTTRAVGVARTPSGLGGWVVAADGGVFTFGDARLLRVDGRIAPQPADRRHGRDPDRQRLLARRVRRRHLHVRRRALLRLDRRPPPQPADRRDGGDADGRGYWFVASDGGIFTFGDAWFYGSTGGAPPSAPIVGHGADTRRARLLAHDTPRPGLRVRRRAVRGRPPVADSRRCASASFPRPAATASSTPQATCSRSARRVDGRESRARPR